MPGKRRGGYHRVFSYRYKDLAALYLTSTQYIASLKFRGKLEPGSLKSIIEYYNDTKRKERTERRLKRVVGFSKGMKRIYKRVMSSKL